MVRKGSKEAEILISEFMKDGNEFILRCKQIDEELAEIFEHRDKVKLARVLYDVMDEAKRILEVLSVYCSFCRQVGGRELGECAQCGRPVCTLCGSIVDEKAPLHSDICRLWYKKG